MYILWKKIQNTKNETMHSHYIEHSLIQCCLNLCNSWPSLLLLFWVQTEINHSGGRLRHRYLLHFHPSEHHEHELNWTEKFWNFSMSWASIFINTQNCHLIFTFFFFSIFCVVVVQFQWDRVVSWAVFDLKFLITLILLKKEFDGLLRGKRTTLGEVYWGKFYQKHRKNSPNTSFWYP